MFEGKNSIEQNYYSLMHSKLGKKVAVISDLHQREYRFILDIVSDGFPDYIFIPGDMVLKTTL